MACLCSCVFWPRLETKTIDQKNRTWNSTMKTNDIFVWSMSGSEWFWNSFTEYLGQEKAMPVYLEVIKWPQLFKIHLMCSQDSILDQWYHQNDITVNSFTNNLHSLSEFWNKMDSNRRFFLFTLHFWRIAALMIRIRK